MMESVGSSVRKALVGNNMKQDKLAPIQELFSNVMNYWEWVWLKTWKILQINEVEF